jgi:hypothetical protein
MRHVPEDFKLQHRYVHKVHFKHSEKDNEHTHMFLHFK